MTIQEMLTAPNMLRDRDHNKLPIRWKQTTKGT